MIRCIISNGRLLIAGATVTNITGVGSFADEIATFGTYNVYHSSLTAHSAPDTITSKNNASCRNDVKRT